jgi:hypothetical protein
MNGKRDGGFTLMETLVSIALLMICAAALGQVLYRVRGSVVQLREKIAGTYRTLRFERIVRETAEGIAIPYWEKEDAPAALAAAEAAVLAELEKTGDGENVVLEILRDKAGRLRGIRGIRRPAERPVERPVERGAERPGRGGGEAAYEARGLFASVPVTGGAE